MCSVYFGIDFGTTRSCITAIDDNGITTLNLTNHFTKTIDSIVSYYANNTYAVGINDPFADKVVIYPKTNLNNPDNFSSAIHILSYMVDKAIEQCNTFRPIKAVITVPTRFNESQRNIVKEAAVIAGIDCIQLLHEPTAAAISYGVNEKCNGSYIVYDLGGGTLDITMIDIDNELFHVIDTEGNITIGSNEVNKIIYDNIIQNNQIPFNIINAEIEKKKILLCSDYNLLWVDICKRYNDVMTKTSLSKEQLVMYLTKWYSRCCIPLTNILNKANKADLVIDKILLVGGGTKTIGLKDAIRKNAESILVYEHPNPDYLISQGAAIKAYGKNPLISTTITLLDTVSLTLGIDTGGTFTPLITRGNVLPCSALKKFTTTEDNQTSIKIAIYQGERTEIIDNELIDVFFLELASGKPKGVPVIDVTFYIDNSGILTVTAQDSKDGIENSITINKKSFEKTSLEIDKIIEHYHKNKHIDTQKQEILKLTICVREIIDHILLNINSEYNKLDTSYVEQHTNKLLNIVLPNNVDELNALKLFLTKEYDFCLIEKEIFQSHNADNIIDENIIKDKYIDNENNFYDDYDDNELIKELTSSMLSDSDRCIMEGLLLCNKDIRIKGLKNLLARYTTLVIDERQQLINELLTNVEHFSLDDSCKTVLVEYLKNTDDSIDDINYFCQQIVDSNTLT